MELLDHPEDPVALIEFLSRRFAPPELRTTDGEQMVIRLVEITVPDPGAARTVLDRLFEYQEDSGEWLLLAGHRHAAMRSVHATLTMTDGRILIEANSAERVDRVLDTLRGHLDRIAVVRDESTRPYQLIDVPKTGDADLPGVRGSGDARQGSRSHPGLAFGGIPDDAVREVLAQATAHHEAAWVDDHIPALAGLTPREALEDPTRREDLIRLLDSFPQTEDPTQMSGLRLKRVLGLV